MLLLKDGAKQKHIELWIVMQFCLHANRKKVYFSNFTCGKRRVKMGEFPANSKNVTMK